MPENAVSFHALSLSFLSHRATSLVICFTYDISVLAATFVLGSIGFPFHLLVLPQGASEAEARHRRRGVVAEEAVVEADCGAAAAQVPKVYMSII